MKIYAYGVRDFDEIPFFNEYSKEFGVEIGVCPDPISLENIGLSSRSDYISVITNPVTAPMLDALKANGIKMVSTRTIGFDHVDCEHAKKIGMPVSNATYNADCVAEYSIMLLLMALRKMKRIMQRAVINDFTLKGVNGGILHERTVGVIGTGRIGRTLVRDLQGFGCKVYAYDVYPNADLDVEYLPLEELYKRCDVISLHAPLTEDTFHMIDKKAIDMMPDGVIIINTARGGLIDSNALIDALESGKVAACGLDVVEDEFNMYYYDRRSDVLGNRKLSILRDMPNVVVTPHMAFYTDRSVSDMVRNSIISCVKHSKGEENPFRVV
ncbi:MAG: lactate dehydrogenase [Clostridia bacterium]|nr:lactate dehydrogenase [Clostridia bacterium]